MGVGIQHKYQVWDEGLGPRREALGPVWPLSPYAVIWVWDNMISGDKEKRKMINLNPFPFLQLPSCFQLFGFLPLWEFPRARIYIFLQYLRLSRLCSAASDLKSDLEWKPDPQSVSLTTDDVRLLQQLLWFLTSCGCLNRSGAFWRPGWWPQVSRKQQMWPALPRSWVTGGEASEGPPPISVLMLRDLEGSFCAFIPFNALYLALYLLSVC